MTTRPPLRSLLVPLSAIGLLALLALLVGACGGLDLPFRDRETPELPSAVVRRESLVDSTVALGTLRPQVGAEVEVGSRISGVVERLLVGIGDTVRPGQLLAALQDDDLRARARVAKAELESALAERDFAETELARMERQAELVAAREIDQKRRDLAVRRAAVEQARASLAQAELTLGYAEIRAPVAGTVASVSTYVGETVAASFAAPTFVTLVDLDRLEVQVWVDETDVGRVEVGQTATVRVDAFPGSRLVGRVRAIYPKAELVDNVVTYVAIVDLDAHDGLLLRPEMTVHVDLELERRDDAVVVPRSAVFQKGGQDGGRAVVVVEEGGSWRERAVEVGLATPERLEIRSGLEAGERIVTDKEAWRAWKESER